MTLYDAIKKHSTGKGEDAMWRSVSLISDYLAKNGVNIDPLIRDLYGELCGYHYDEELAKEQIEEMFYVDKDGIKHKAPYWTEEVMMGFYDNVRNLIPSHYNAYDFIVALSMIKSDYGNLLESWFDGNADQHIVDMTVAYFNDPDTKYRDCKIWAHFNKVL